MMSVQKGQGYLLEIFNMPTEHKYLLSEIAAKYFPNTKKSFKIKTKS